MTSYYQHPSAPVGGVGLDLSTSPSRFYSTLANALAASPPSFSASLAANISSSSSAQLSSMSTTQHSHPHTGSMHVSSSHHPSHSSSSSSNSSSMLPSSLENSSELSVSMNDNDLDSGFSPRGNSYGQMSSFLQRASVGGGAVGQNHDAVDFSSGFALPNGEESLLPAMQQARSRSQTQEKNGMNIVQEKISELQMQLMEKKAAAMAAMQQAVQQAQAQAQAQQHHAVMAATSAHAAAVAASSAAFSGPALALASNSNSSVAVKKSRSYTPAHADSESENDGSDNDSDGSSDNTDDEDDSDHERRKRGKSSRNGKSSSRSKNKNSGGIPAKSSSIMQSSSSSGSGSRSSKKRRRGSSESDENNKGSSNSSNGGSNQEYVDSNGNPLTKAQIRRLKHREIDARRRKREADALSQLSNLIERHTGETAISATSDRVTILTKSADVIASLQDKLAALNGWVEEIKNERREAAAEAANEERRNGAEGEKKVSKSTELSPIAAAAFQSAQDSVALTRHKDSQILTMQKTIQSLLQQLESSTRRQESLSLFASVFLHSGAAQLIVDMRGLLIDCNHIYKQLTGWEDNEVRGKVACSLSCFTFMFPVAKQIGIDDIPLSPIWKPNSGEKDENQGSTAPSSTTSSQASAASRSGSSTSLEDEYLGSGSDSNQSSPDCTPPPICPISPNSSFFPPSPVDGSGKNAHASSSTIPPSLDDLFGSTHSATAPASQFNSVGASSVSGVSISSIPMPAVPVFEVSDTLACVPKQVEVRFDAAYKAYMQNFRPLAAAALAKLTSSFQHPASYVHGYHMNVNASPPAPAFFKPVKEEFLPKPIGMQPSDVAAVYKQCPPAYSTLKSLLRVYTGDDSIARSSFRIITKNGWLYEVGCNIQLVFDPQTKYPLYHVVTASVQDTIPIGPAKQFLEPHSPGGRFQAI